MNFFKNLRLNKKLKLREVATLLGVSASYISMIENNKRTPSKKLILNLSKFYKVSVIEILKEIT